MSFSVDLPPFNDSFLCSRYSYETKLHVIVSIPFIAIALVAMLAGGVAIVRCLVYMRERHERHSSSAEGETTCERKAVPKKFYVSDYRSPDVSPIVGEKRTDADRP